MTTPIDAIRARLDAAPDPTHGPDEAHLAWTVANARRGAFLEVLGLLGCDVAKERAEAEERRFRRAGGPR